MRKALIAPALVAAVLLAACGGAAEQTGPDAGTPAAGTTPTTGGPSPSAGPSPDGGASPGGGTDGPGSATGPGLTVEEARNSDAEGPLLVTGYIIAESDVVRLCSLLLESLPPQCGEPSIQVVGLDLDDYPVKERSGVAWTEDLVQVLGEVEGGVLHARSDGTAAGSPGRPGAVAADAA